MWTSLALAVLTLAPYQPGPLALTHVRSTYGVLGAPRPDNKYLAGDQFCLSFDIEGARVDGDGKVLYSIGMDVSDSQGKVLFRQAPRDLEAFNTLGGSSLPAFASAQIGLDAPAGTYSVKITVTDRAARASQSVNGTYEILPRAFGLVHPTLTGDADGHVPVAFVAEGQPLWVNLSAVGFGREAGANGKPNVTVAMRVLDDAGRPTRAKPFSGTLNADTPASVRALPMQFALDANRAGKFTIELTATDKTTGKTASLSLPLTVLKAR